jgi:hypothetical protein
MPYTRTPTCERWARTIGIQFEPAKSELLQLTRTRTAPSQEVRLGATVVKQVEVSRFLGISLDRKLRWQAYLRKIEEKHAI